MTQWLAQALGHGAAAVVIERAGGTRLTIPVAISDRPEYVRLVATFGGDIALDLVAHFGGTPIYIPSGTTSAPVQVARVVELTRGGMTARRIALLLKCSERCIYAKRASARLQNLL